MDDYFRKECRDMFDTVNSILTILTDLIDFCVQIISDNVIYVSISILLIAGFFVCILPVIRNTFALKRVTRKIEKSGTDVLSDTKIFRRKCLNDCWDNYLTNHELLAKNNSHCDIREYFNAQTVISLPEKAQLSDILPGIFTSLGILGTFVGLTKGVSGIDASSAANMQLSINTLLSGMEVAFKTSIWGVVCAVIYNILRRTVNSCALTQISRFVQQCEKSLYQPVTAESEMLSLTRQMLDSQACLAEKIGNELVEALHAEVNPAFERMSNVFSNYAENSLRRQDKGVSEMLDIFVDKMNGNMQDQIDALNQAISNTVQMQAEQTKIQEMQNEAISSASTSLIEQLQGAQAIEQAYRETLLHFNATAAEMQQVQKTIQATYEQSNEHYVQMVERYAAMENHVQLLTQNLTTSIQSSMESIDELSAKVNHSTANSHELIDSCLSRMNAHSEDILKSLNAYADNIKAMLAEHMQETMVQFKNTMEHSQNDFSGIVTELKATNSALIHSSGALSESVQDFEDNIHSGLGQSFSAFDKAMSDAIERLQLVLTGMQESIDDIPKGLQDQTKKYVDRMAVTSAIIEDFIKKHNDIVEKQHHR